MWAVQRRGGRVDRQARVEHLQDLDADLGPGRRDLRSGPPDLRAPQRSGHLLAEPFRTRWPVLQPVGSFGLWSQPAAAARFVLGVAAATGASLRDSSGGVEPTGDSLQQLVVDGSRHVHPQERLLPQAQHAATAASSSSNDSLGGPRRHHRVQHDPVLVVGVAGHHRHAVGVENPADAVGGQGPAGLPDVRHERLDVDLDLQGAEVVDARRPPEELLEQVGTGVEVDHPLLGRRCRGDRAHERLAHEG